MRGIKDRRKRNPPPANAMAERINPNKTPLGAKASREVGPKQTLTNGNCKAKENDELPPPDTMRETPEEQSNLTICLSLPPPPFVYHPWVGHVYQRQTN